jgi:hypothetical protein
VEKAEVGRVKMEVGSWNAEGGKNRSWEGEKVGKQEVEKIEGKRIKVKGERIGMESY